MSTDKSSPHDSHRSIIKSTSIVSLGTVSSRILGFLRDIILAQFLGTAARADAFFVALRIPNLFRDLVGEGAANSAVVPVFAEYVDKKDKTALWNFISVVFCLLLITLSLITLVGMIFAPVIVRVMAPGFAADPYKLELTVNLTRIMFPYLVFIGLTAYSMAILYTFRSFAVAAFSPCLLNIAMIIAAVIASRKMTEPVYGLAIGVLVGGVLQLAVQIRPMLKAGVRFVRPRTLSHEGARKIGKLLVPRLFGSGVYQLNIFVDTFCASLSSIVGTGGISAIYYANRIIQFPIGVFSLALAAAVLPSLSGLAARKDMAAFKKTLTFALQNILLIMLPSAVFLMILSNPIIKIFFQRGEFDAYSTQITGQALFFFAIGLAGFGAVKIMVTGFHALQDTLTPVKVAALCLVINFVLNLVLMHPLQVGGIALASSISGTVNFWVLYQVMSKRLGGLHDGIAGYSLKVCLATGVMAAVVWFGWTGLLSLSEFIRFFTVVVAGAAAFFVTGLFLEIEQLRSIEKWVRNRGK